MLQNLIRSSEVEGEHVNCVDVITPSLTLGETRNTRRSFGHEASGPEAVHIGLGYERSTDGERIFDVFHFPADRREGKLTYINDTK